MLSFIRSIKTGLAALLLALPVSAQQITTSQVPQINTPQIGIISGLQAGIQPDFWRGMTQDQAVALIEKQRNHKFITAQKFIQRLLLSDIAAPEARNRSTDFQTARLDHLITQGAIEEANALIQKMEITNAPIFSRWFDINLYLLDPIKACAPLKAKPELSNDVAPRIYCLAINKDWFAADLALSQAHDLGLIEDSTAHLLAAFLEPDILDEENTPVPIANTILELTIADALALPRISANLPAGYYLRDLSENNGWLLKLRAAERLAKNGAISPRYLSEVYAQGVPSASGAIWARVKSVNALKSALASQDSALICKVLIDASSHFSNDGLLPLLARITAEEISAIAFDATECFTPQIDLILLHPNWASLLFDLVEEIPSTSALHAVITKELSTAQPDDDLDQAVLKNLGSTGTKAKTNLRLLEDLGAIADGMQSSNAQIGKAIGALYQQGYADVATDLALEALILARQ